MTAVVHSVAFQCTDIDGIIHHIADDLNHILATGVQVKFGVNVGTDVTLENLLEQYDAVYLSIGATHGDTMSGIVGLDMIRSIHFQYLTAFCNQY